MMTSLELEVCTWPSLHYVHLGIINPVGTDGGPPARMGWSENREQREREREREREGGREGGRERGRERGREGGKEGERERERYSTTQLLPVFLVRPEDALD